ncbi:unnamed protein product [Rhizoctonia solani]|uniref:Uncharacterized protein n=1 Tax=Rhizoctonia solani TaxID=456999 RepID=A0A8H2WBP6_9AGAM|nr:unnamed protein product [Rhizoctonia solani]
MLKYQTWYRHRVKEDNLQAMLALQTRLRSNIHNNAAISHEHGQDEPDLSAHHPVQPDEQIDEELHEDEIETEFKREIAMFDDPLGLVHSHVPDSGPGTPHDPNSLVLQFNQPPNREHLESQSPPVLQLLDLDVDYDSDDSKSNYEFLHAYSDPPALRYAYLNALSSHIVWKSPVRDAEANLKHTLTCLWLTPSGIPDHITPLTTLKSIRTQFGLNTSGLLHQVPICNKCYKQYLMADISSAELPAICTWERPTCSGSYMKLATKNGNTVPPLGPRSG